MDSMELKAEYVDSSVTLPDEPLIALFPTIIVDPGNKSMLLFANSDMIPSGCIRMESGILLKKGSYSGELTINTPDILITKVPPASTQQFFIRKNNVTTGDIWYARAYMMYKDSSGKVYIVYSSNTQSVTIS
jgi:hypothetical protein